MTLQAPSTKASPSLQRPSITERLRPAYPLLLVVSVCWVANYLHFTAFGYYEDDWYYYPAAFAHPPAAWFGMIFGLMKQFLQGRPLLLLWEALFGYLGAAFSSTTLPYVLAFISLSARSVLLYYVLRLKFPRAFCTIAALFSVLSPLTTMRQSLDTEFFLGPAFVMLFTAILIRRLSTLGFIAAYVLAALTLLTYESVFLLFLSAPLFAAGKWNRKRVRSYAIHLAICALMVAGFILVRHAVGEDRILTVSKVGGLELLKQTAAFDLRFTLYSFWSYLYATKVALRELPIEAALYTAGFFVCALLLFFHLVSRRLAGHAGWSRLACARRLWWVRNGCVVGLLLVIIGYLTAYFQMSGGPGFPIAGRDTRFSATAVWGSSMFAASVLMLALTFSRRPIPRIAAHAFAISCLSILFIYSFVIQDDYIRAWEYTRNFLSQAVVLTPDLRDNTLIIVHTGAHPQPGFGPVTRAASVASSRHGVQVSLQCLSGLWYTAPRIYFVDTDEWKRSLAFGRDGKLHWTQKQIPGGTWGGTDDPVAGRIILLREHEDGSLSRLQDAVAVDGSQIIQLPPSRLNTFHSEWSTINASGLLERIVYGAARTMVKLGTPAEQPPGPEPPQGTRDVALGKDAQQSSTLGVYSAERGVDGVKKILGFSGFHTALEQNPWWQVDLGQRFSVYQVRLFNGQKEYYRRAATVRVLFSADGSAWSMVYDNLGKPFGPEPLIMDLNGTAARYVRVQLAEANYLHLEEVEVFGK